MCHCAKIWSFTYLWKLLFVNCHIPTQPQQEESHSPHPRQTLFSCGAAGLGTLGATTALSFKQHIGRASKRQMMSGIQISGLKCPET